MSKAIVRLLFLCVTFSLAATTASAGVLGANFDAMPVGPYNGGAQILEGNAAAVTVATAGTETPPVSNGSGNVLSIDARGELGRIVVEFTFECDWIPLMMCVVKYDYSATNSFSGSNGFEVHVDAGGVYDNPDDAWLPVGLESVWGDNTEGAGACDGGVHTITFIVFPGTVLNIDNMTTRCDPPVSVETQPWSLIKRLYQ